MPARFISHYRLVRLLGAGGMGEVYLAQDPNRGPVALKVMPEELARDHNQRKRFRTEAEAAFGLSHPHICAIYGVGETKDGRPFIAMEYVEGQTLDTILQVRRLKLREVVKLGIQVADALEVAHACGLVHRDIKPANLMVNRLGQVKVMDFGLAKRFTPGELSGALTSAAHTRTGMLIGTPQYMSPEQALGHSLGPTTDIFSLGVVLYELVAGQRPFLGQTVGESINSIVNQAPAPLGLQDPLFTPVLDQIIFKCLEKDPEKRYLSARELASELRELKPGLDPDASAVEVTDLPSVLTPGERQPTALWKLAARARSGQKTVLRRLIALVVVAVLAAGGWVLMHDTKLERVESDSKVAAKTPTKEHTKLTTTNAEAYQLYLEGRYLWEHRTRGDFKQAAERFKQAIDKDPAFAMAYSGLADCYYLYWEGLPKDQAFARAQATASKALDLDPSLGQPHAVLACVKAYRDWDWRGAEEEFRKAIALHPTYATAHLWFARMLKVLCRWDEALAEIERAHELDPLSQVITGYRAFLLAQSGKADSAIELLRQEMHRDPSDLLHGALGWAYTAKGKWTEAIAEFSTLPSADPNWSWARGALGFAHAHAGNINEAQRILGQILELDQGQGGGMEAALVQHALGDDEFAVNTLERVFVENPTGLQDLNSDFQWKELRPHPRVQAMLRKMNLTH